MAQAYQSRLAMLQRQPYAVENVATASSAVAVTCQECGAPFMLSVRNEQRHRREGRPHRCRECRFVTRVTPAAIEAAKAWWLERYSVDELRSWPEW
jgi:hypothetical protein